MKKRFASIVLTLAMMLSLCQVAFAAGGVTVSVGNATAQQGETVSVDVNLTENPGFVTCGVKVE